MYDVYFEENNGRNKCLCGLKKVIGKNGFILLIPRNLYKPVEKNQI